MLLVPCAIFAEWTRVNKCRSAVCRLHKIWQDRFGEQRHHSAGCAQFAGANGLSFAGNADDDGFKSLRADLCDLSPARRSP